jgi:hypothetical protein
VSAVRTPPAAAAVRRILGIDPGLRVTGFGIIDSAEDWLVLDRPILAGTPLGTLAELREGCDHTIATCASRFGNAANFRGEPFVPGNDLLARYGQS